MIAEKLLDASFRQAPLVFCVAFLCISIHALAEVPSPRDPVAVPIPRVAKGKPTQISALASQYNAEKHSVRFVDQVVLTNPKMRLTSDVLDVRLRQGASGPAAAAAGAIQSATASGYVVIHTTNAQGKPVVAHAREAEFDAVSNTVILSDRPQLQDGGQLVEGTAPHSQIILNANGKHQTKGPTKITIVDTAKTGLNLPR